MIVRQEHLSPFDEIARARFEREAVEHVKGFAPKHTEVLGEDGTRTVVRAGIERAARYDFNAPGPVHFFLDLMFVLGSEFDKDPQYPWAAEILNDKSIPGQMPRADRLHGRASEYFDKVAGPDNQFAKQALQRVQSLRTSGQSPQADPAMLRSIYPEKAAYLGESGTRDLVARSNARAASSGMASQAAAVLFAALEFTLGHAFDHDPLYPWIASTLTNPAMVKPEDRLRRLYEKTTIYLDHTIAYLSETKDGKV